MANQYDTNYDIKYLDDFAIKEHNGRCTSKIFTKMSNKYWWLCEFGHKWQATGHSVVNSGSWCPDCAGNAPKSIKYLDDFAIKEHNGRCTSKIFTKMSNKYWWKCKNGHKWEANAHNVVNHGSWCPDCSIKKAADRHRKSIQYLDDFARKEHNGRCISKTFTRMDAKYEWLCEFGHKWQAKGNNVVYAGSWCPTCDFSKSEKQALDIFEKYTNIKLQRNKRYDWLRNPKTNYPLELDGYNKEYKIAVEYQGEQHFEPMGFRGGSVRFKDTQYKDDFKRKTCKEKDILLLTPDHTMKTEKEIKNYYKKKLRGYI